MKHFIFTMVTAMLLLSMAGCASLEKQRSRAQTFYKEHPTELAEMCATNYPPIYKPGKPVEGKRDTIYLPGDSVDCPPTINPATGKTTVPRVQCPPGKTIYIPTLRVDTVESTALLARLEKQRQDLADTRSKLTTAETDLDTAKGQARARLWIAIGLGAAIAGYIGFKVYRRIKP